MSKPGLGRVDRASRPGQSIWDKIGYYIRFVIFFYICNIHSNYVPQTVSPTNKAHTQYRHKCASSAPAAHAACMRSMFAEVYLFCKYIIHSNTHTQTYSRLPIIIVRIQCHTRTHTHSRGPRLIACLCCRRMPALMRARVSRARFTRALELLLVLRTWC